MFTSRAEYRLSLRADNADERLTDKGLALGCVGAERARHHEASMQTLRVARAKLRSLSASPSVLERSGIAVNRDGVRRSAFELASQPHLSLETLAEVWPELRAFDARLTARLEADAKYAVYLDRQDEDIARHRRSEALAKPDDLDFAGMSGLSKEMKAKFLSIRPATLGQASRIEGVTPAALALVAAHARRAARGRSRETASA